MSERTIAKVPGIAGTSAEFRARLYDIAKKHSWNVDAIAAVISSESRFVPSVQNPNGSASGLLQWIDATARSMLGTTSSNIRRMSAEAQLPLVETWFVKMLGDGAHRPVDYYLVGWGGRRGLPLDTVLATKGERNYELNSALDINSDGRITVSDLDARVRNTLAASGGARVDASPLPEGEGGDSPSL